MFKFSHLVFYFCEEKFSIEQTPKIFDERVNALAQAGFDGVELMVCNAQNINVEHLISVLNSCNIGVSAIGSGKVFTKDKLCFSSTDAAQRKAAVERIKQHIDLSCKIGAPPIVLGSIRGDTLNDKAADLYNIKSCLKECAIYAQHKNVKLALEPIDKSETPFINSVQQALEMIEEININSLGIALDNCNMQAEENDVLKAIEFAKNYIYHVQVADITRFNPSSGGSDLKPFLKGVYDAGYKGFISIEPCEFKISPIKDAENGLNYLRRILF